MEIYTARPGDSPGSVAHRRQCSAEELIMLNQLGDSRRLTSGLALLLPDTQIQRRSTLEVALCVRADPDFSVDPESLERASFVSAFACVPEARGTLSLADDDALISAALAAGVLPIMTVANLDGGGFSPYMAHELFCDEALQTAFFSDLSQCVRKKRCGGVNFNFQYLRSFDRDSYSRFMIAASQVLHRAGVLLFSTLPPRCGEGDCAFVSQAHDYALHGEYCDRVIVLARDYGSVFSPPQAPSPTDKVLAALDYACENIPSGKLLLGISPSAYNWTLPWCQGDRAEALSPSAAADLAVSQRAEIRFDLPSQTPYFYYNDPMGRRHVVWYEDVRTLRCTLEQVSDYALAGISLWHSSRPCPCFSALLESMYIPEKLL